MVSALWAYALSPAHSFPDKYDDQIKQSVRKWWIGPEWQWWKAQLWQESRFDPCAVSPVGAKGLAQFMPATWAEVSQQMDLGDVPATHARHAIDAGAYYMARLSKQWSSPRPTLERHYLAMASYNAGLGNILKAQRFCEGALLWGEISPCLEKVTGQHSRETLGYVRLIRKWRDQQR